ncbi:hypothetical protein L288_15540 [Sphingobium quisquiliarum P25]|uniref:VOC domain-containing protein n=1 Tax=Sphingobium quisquiliarum P25 TaxID=1329909 RepID=T0HZC7_9SPHN|nr:MULTISPECIES: VOC family protein [Sphingobium]EQB02844.1 hypothetical protein L288_15540 [Sphingobium quisquiliarum P25]
MAILGIETIIYGVSDMAECTRFWQDFGLKLTGQADDRVSFEVLSGSKVILLHADDPALPPRNFEGDGVRLTVWGVDTQDNLEQLVKRVERRVPVRREADGSAFFQAPDGQYLGLRVWAKRPVLSVADPVNTPGNIVRLNQHRQWRMRAIPKTINHVVFYTDNYVESFEFYRDCLNFRYSDHSKGIGIFARADGTYEHHSIFWVNARMPFAPGGHGFLHTAFGVDDIDEVMIGANIMEKQGWQKTADEKTGGISRHRISSAIYYYVKCPAGGEAEYHADTDYLDDNWVPRAWDYRFGSLMWANARPAAFTEAVTSWDMTFDPDQASFEPYRDGTGPDGMKPRPLAPREMEAQSN